MTRQINLLASDMDGTVIPQDDHPCRVQEIEDFRQAVESTPDLRLAYATGRHLELALEGVARHGLPRPDFMICDVGTSLYACENKAWQLDPDYRADLLLQFGGASPEAIRQALQEIPALTLQPEDRQAEFKISYHVSGTFEPDPLVSQVEAAIEAAGIAPVQIVVSLDPLTGHGLLDLLPRDAAKDRAVRFLASKLGIPAEQVVYAGDSGNDLDAFLSGFRAILVANTEEWVKEKVGRGIPDARKDRIYMARAPYTAGVLEGARHFGILPFF